MREKEEEYKVWNRLIDICKSILKFMFLEYEVGELLKFLICSVRRLDLYYGNKCYVEGVR